MPETDRRTHPLARRSLRWLLIGALAATLTACGAAVEPDPEPDPDPDPDPTPTVEAVYRVNAGTTTGTLPDDYTGTGPAVTDWIADDEGSVTFALGRPYPNVTQTSVLVEGDIDASATDAGPAALYLSTRGTDSAEGDTQFSYSLPIDGLSADDNDTYTVRLHFAEIFYNTDNGPIGSPATGNRVFDVEIEGTVVLNDFDIEAAAGGSLTAIVQEFTDITDVDANDAIDIVFLNDAVDGAENAKVSAIELDIVRNP
jgi:hypothetical protein